MRFLRLVFVSFLTSAVESGCKRIELCTHLLTCTERDSAKDQAVVYTFILLTVGLLAYAGIRPYIEKRMNPSRQDNTGYEQIPVRQTGLGTG